MIQSRSGRLHACGPIFAALLSFPSVGDAQTAPVASTPTPHAGCDAATPRDQAQRGWEAQSSGHWVEAETCLRAVSASEDHWVRHHRRELAESLATVEEHVGGLQVTGGVAGTHVLLDGLPIATLPMTGPVRVIAGQVRLSVSADGYYPVDRTLRIAPGEVPSIEMVAMRPLPVEPPRPVIVPTSVPVVVQVPAPTPLPPPPAAPTSMEIRTPVVVFSSTPEHSQAEAPSGGVARALAWSAAVGGALGLGAGIVGSYMVLTAGNTYASTCSGAIPASQVAMCQGLLTTARTNQGTGETLEIAGYAAAGALAVTAIVLFVVAASHESPHRQGIALRCGDGPGTVGLTCGMSF